MAVDFSMPYQEDRFGLLSHVPAALPKWRAIFWPFGKMVWISVALSCVLFGTSFYAFLRLINDGNAISLLSCILQSAKALFLQCKQLIFQTCLAQLDKQICHYYCFSCK